MTLDPLVLSRLQFAWVVAWHILLPALTIGLASYIALLEGIWFATGKDDFLVETSRATVAMFKKHGFDIVYKETAGGHTWINWRDYLHEFAPQLFR